MIAVRDLFDRDLKEEFQDKIQIHLGRGFIHFTLWKTNEAANAHARNSSHYNMTSHESKFDSLVVLGNIFKKCY